MISLKPFKIAKRHNKMIFRDCEYRNKWEVYCYNLKGCFRVEKDWSRRCLRDPFSKNTWYLRRKTDQVHSASDMAYFPQPSIVYPKEPDSNATSSYFLYWYFLLTLPTFFPTFEAGCAKLSNCQLERLASNVLFDFPSLFDPSSNLSIRR